MIIVTGWNVYLNCIRDHCQNSQIFETKSNETHDTRSPISWIIYLKLWLKPIEIEPGYWMVEAPGWYDVNVHLSFFTEPCRSHSHSHSQSSSLSHSFIFVHFVTCGQMKSTTFTYDTMFTSLTFRAPQTLLFVADFIDGNSRLFRLSFVLQFTFLVWIFCPGKIHSFIGSL